MDKSRNLIAKWYDHVFWSSFSGEDEKLSSDGDINIPVKLLAGNTLELRERGFATRALMKYEGDKTVIKALSDALKNNIDSDVRGDAALALGYIAQGNRAAIKALKYALKNDKDSFVRETADEALTKVLP